MKIYAVRMEYWNYWLDACHSGYECEVHYFSKKESVDEFITEHEFFCKGYDGICEAKGKYANRKPEFYVTEIIPEDE